MINLFNAHIENLSIHRVGNKSRNEAIFLSDKPYGLNDEIVPLLKEYFFYIMLFNTIKSFIKIIFIHEILI